MHKHVFLVGKYDSVTFKEMLTTKLVRVYLHDCDEYMAETSEVKFSTGQATFTFKDFLRPFCHELKLRSDVFPMKREEKVSTQQRTCCKDSVAIVVTVGTACFKAGKETCQSGEC